jgi:hypothetical protein
MAPQKQPLKEKKKLRKKEREAGSDDEDLGAGGGFPGKYLPNCSSQLIWQLSAFPRAITL